MKKQATNETFQADKTPHQKHASLVVTAAFVLPSPSVEKLRHRGILFGADQSDKQAARQAMPERQEKFSLTPAQTQRWPLYADYLARHNGWSPPLLTRKPGPRRRQFDRLFAACGSLAFLRLTLPELDCWPLRSDDLPAFARPLLKSRVPDLLLPDSSYTVDLQRGGNTHAHIVTPASALLSEHHAQVLAAKHGPGGGCELGSLSHGVLMLDSPINRRRVARYVTRFPDGRGDEPGTEAYLDAIEDELQRLQTATKRAPRLGWECNLQRWV